MIKLLIRQLNTNTGKIKQKVIKFDGGFKDGNVIQGAFSWKPTIKTDGWKVIKEIKND